MGVKPVAIATRRQWESTLGTTLATTHSRTSGGGTGGACTWPPTTPPPPTTLAAMAVATTTTTTTGQGRQAGVPQGVGRRQPGGGSHHPLHHYRWLARHLHQAGQGGGS